MQVFDRDCGAWGGARRALLCRRKSQGLDFSQWIQLHAIELESGFGKPRRKSARGRGMDGDNV